MLTLKLTFLKKEFFFVFRLLSQATDYLTRFMWDSQSPVYATPSSALNTSEEVGALRAVLPCIWTWWPHASCQRWLTLRISGPNSKAWLMETGSLTSPTCSKPSPARYIQPSEALVKAIDERKNFRSKGSRVFLLNSPAFMRILVSFEKKKSFYDTSMDFSYKSKIEILS